MITRFKTARSVMVVAICLLTISGLATACSSSKKKSSSDMSITIGLTGKDAIFADVIVAEEKGYFAKAKVKVKLLDQEATATTNAAAGRIDLAGSGTSSALPAAVHGRQTSIVYGWISGTAVAGLVVAKDSPARSVMDLSGKRVVTKGTGSSSYGAAETWSKYIVAHGGKALTLVPVNSTGSMVAKVASGQVAAGAGSLTQYTAPLSQGKARLLVSPTSKLAATVFPKDLIGNAYWGLQSDLQEKKTALTRMISGLRAADQFIHDSSIAQVSEILTKSSYLKGIDAASIKAGVGYDKPFYAPSLGEITEQAWTTSLKSYADFGLTVPVNGKPVQFGSIVDMSYLQAAKKAAL